MNKSPLWKNLRLLVEIDQNRTKIASQIADIEKKIDEDKAMLPELEQTIAQLKQERLQAKKNVDLQELNTKHLSDKEKEKRKALDIVKKQKEHDAIEKELHAILKQLAEQDDAMVQAWHNLESAQKKEATQAKEFGEKIELIKKDIAEKENTIAQIKADNKELEEKRIAQAKIIPEDWLLKYEMMIRKVQDPIVPLINTSCSSCYYSVPPQDIVRLKRSAILPCRSCYRFLYHDDLEEEESY